MFPARQRSDSSHALKINHVVQARATTITEYRAFHVRWLEFSTLHYDIAAWRDGALSNVQAVVVVLRDTDDDCDLGRASGCADASHLGRIVRNRVLDVFSRQRWIERSSPVVLLSKVEVLDVECRKLTRSRLDIP